MNDEEIKIFQLIKLIICLNLLEIYTMKRANELYKNDTTKRKSYDNDEQYDNINNTELNSSIEQKYQNQYII